MSEVKTMELVAYRDLTPVELRRSNYSDSKFGGVFLRGVNRDTGYVYSVEITKMNGFDRPIAPYLRVRTEKRGAFLKKGTEREGEDALREVSFAMRSRTGGVFEIDSFYGGVASLSTDCGLLSTTIYLINGGNLSESHAELPNPNQGTRNEAIRRGVLEQYDAEFERYNPRVKRKGLMARIFGGGEQSADIPPSMDITQDSVADFMDCLQGELGFKDLEIGQTNYFGLTLVEFEASTIPREKVKYYPKDFELPGLRGELE